MLPSHVIPSALKRAADRIWYPAEDIATDPVSYPDSGHDYCAALEDHSFWFGHRNRCISALINRHTPPSPGTIYDIGGGNGAVSRVLSGAGHRVVLVEPGRQGAHNARRRGVDHVVCATLQSAGFENNSLPAVGFFDVLEHLSDDREALRLAWDKLLPDGALYITVPAYAGLWSHEDTAAGHYRRYTVTGLRRLLKSAGFSVGYAGYIFTALPAPIFAARSAPYLFSKIVRRPGDVPKKRDPAAHHHANTRPELRRRIETFFSFEASAIRRGISLPFGGSCIIAARKSDTG